MLAGILAIGGGLRATEIRYRYERPIYVTQAPEASILHDARAFYRHVELDRVVVTEDLPVLLQFLSPDPKISALVAINVLDMSGSRRQYCFKTWTRGRVFPPAAYTSMQPWPKRNVTPASCK
jgi:hypothetical protein